MATIGSSPPFDPLPLCIMFNLEDTITYKA